MKGKSNIRLLEGLCLVLLLGVTGCFGGEEQAGDMHEGTISVEDAQELTGSVQVDEKLFPLLEVPFQEQFPNMELVSTSPSGSYEQYMQGEKRPDLFIGDMLSIEALEEFDFTYDLSSLLSEHNIDVSRFDPDAWASVESLTNKNEVWALPYGRSVGALYYNPDIFSTFGIFYPQY